MSEFTINNFITLKLEDGKTNIYVLGEEFIQCKYLFMNIPVQDIEQCDEINSIDEAAKKLGKSLELGNPEGYHIRKEIPPKVEFWGHCSNLQMWTEQDYDTRFIHSNLAFPLLKKLTEVGDPKAEKIFKNEIGKRFEMGPDSVRQFLVLEGYMDYLSREEMWSVIPNQSEVRILRTIEKETGAEFKFRSYEMEEGDIKPNKLVFSLKNGYVNKIALSNLKNLSALKLEKIFFALGKLNVLKELYLSYNNLKTIPDGVRRVKSLEVLRLNNNELEELPEAIGYLENLVWLILNDNKIKELPESIGRLRLLEELHLDHNQLVELPDSIGNLKSLVKLFLKNNLLENLPGTITGMESLRQLSLSDNLFSDLPKEIIEMKSLRGIGLKNNKINESSSLIASLKKKGVIFVL
jgi:hypothetical protein